MLKEILLDKQSSSNVAVIYKDNEYTYRTTGRGSVNYELIQEGSTELKTIQS